MEKHTLLALSTAHLTEEEFEVLGSKHDLPVRHIGHEYGGLLIISLGTDISHWDWSNVPNLKAIVQYCHEENIQYVDFDRDVEACDEFKQFDW